MERAMGIEPTSALLEVPSKGTPNNRANSLHLILGPRFSFLRLSTNDRKVLHGGIFSSDVSRSVRGLSMFS
jgi:hypothetical protein